MVRPIPQCFSCRAFRYGIYVSLVWRDNENKAHRNPNFEVEFINAVAEMFKEGNRYQQAITELRDKILSNYNNGFTAKNVFLQTIKSVVGV
uniref:Uncharacterized protein n=1 Tax=Meloidogyne enterolobii TaxID=390850 RepID=A0A6V7Y828_MELEN|nr:unnamed protein product [Meloidogyne enterolobii]